MAFTDTKETSRRAISMQKRSTGFTLNSDNFMEKSGRQIAEDFLKHEGIDCKITNIEPSGTDGGRWCFYIEVEMDSANAEKWDKAL